MTGAITVQVQPLAFCHLGASWYLSAPAACQLAATIPCILFVQGTNFSVIVTEGRPDATGLKTVKALDEMGIPTTLILDSGAAYAMDR